jgi:hypothetical protein
MTDLLSHMLDAPVANILILAGLAFLAIAVLGKISGKIEPSTTGRMMSGLLGMVLLIYGIYAHSSGDRAHNQGSQTSGKGVTAGPPSHKPVKSASETPLSGAWKNDNPWTRGIIRLEVQQSGDVVAMHAWGACSRQDCDWGIARGAVREESATLTWDQGFVLRKMVLFPDGSRLRMVLDSVYKGSRSPQHRLEYFVR